MPLLWSFFIAISPAIALLCYFYERDKRQGIYHGSKIKVFLLGLTSIIPASIIEVLGDYLFNFGKLSNYLHQSISLNNSSSIPLADALSMGFLGSAAIEECIKLLYVFLLIKNLKGFNTRVEVIFYTASLGLGFAALENIFYVISFQQSGFPTLNGAMSRAFMSLPMHVICAVAMGFFVGRAKFSHAKNKTLLFLGAWGSATLIHGTYNTLAFLRTPLSILLTIFIVIVGVCLSVRLLKTLIKEDRLTVKKAIEQKKQPSPVNTKSSLRDYARQGNPKAIATLMNRSLQPKGITAKVALDKDCLQVMLESSQVPTTSLVMVIRKGLINLGVESIVRVKVYGRQLGEEIPDWSQEFTLTTPTPSTTSGVNSSPSLATN